jgi:two-component system nitrate/nitrite response regulator NarL
VDDIPETTAGGEKRVVFLLDLGQDDSAIAHGIRSLKERFPESRIVVLAERYCHSHMLISLETGAHGYLINQISCEALVKSLELVSLGEQVYPAQALQSLNGKLPSEARQKQAITEPPVSLSAREADVLKCLSQGKTNKLIARQWGISEATVKVHVKAILRKIHLKNRTEAALWARDHGLGADPVNSNGMG